MGRFINADRYLSTGQCIFGANLFAYCGNNPVNCCDYDGTFWEYLWDTAKSVIRDLLHQGNTYLIELGVDTSKIGAFLLEMTPDENYVYHASFNCWQQYFGYNKGYDFMFDIGTSMKAKYFDFHYDDRLYRLWAWKGDYINLGAGAELGIYYYGLAGHWLVDKKQAMDMSMTLDYCGSTIISYSAKTWWITGFNPAYLNVNQDDLTVTFTVTFNSYGMFEAFRNSPSSIGWSFNRKDCFASYTF